MFLLNWWSNELVLRKPFKSCQNVPCWNLKKSRALKKAAHDECLELPQWLKSYLTKNAPAKIVAQIPSLVLPRT